MTIIIRTLFASDYELVHEVDIATQKQYLKEKFGQMNEDERTSQLVSRQSEFQLNVDSGYCFVAQNKTKIIGFIFAHETSPFHGTLYVRYIGINPEFQGKGSGILLYDKLIEKAKQTGIKEIRTLINTDNPNSVKLHEKAGFRLNDRKEAALKL
jgi:L-amino acid N-acyltransferase YncA